MVRPFSPSSPGRGARIFGGVLVLLACLTARADDRPSPARELRAAQEPMRERDWPKAVEALRAFRTSHPGTEEAKEAWVLEARALLLAKRADEALAATSDFLKAFGQDEWAGRMVHVAADAYAALGRPKDRAGALHVRVDAVTAPEARAKIGLLHLALADEDFDGRDAKDDLGRPIKVRDVARALAGYGRALEVGLPPDARVRARERVALALEETGAPGPAATAWAALIDDLAAKAVTATAEQEERWLVGRGRGLLASGDRDGARKSLRAAVERFPKGPLAFEAMRLLAEERFQAAAQGAGDVAFEEGVTWLRRAILEHRDDPKAGEAQMRLAAAYEERAQSEKAAAEWAAFLERFPKHERVPEARDRRAEALVRAGRFDEAIAEWERFLAAHPNHPLWGTVREKIVNAAFAKADALREQGDPEGAVAAWKAFAERYPADARAPEALLRAGVVLRERKDFEGALALWRQVAGRYAQSPQAAQARLLVALVLEDDLARLEEAVKAYDEVVKSHPGTPQAQEAQARLERLKAKHLELRMDRVVGVAEPPVVRVATRNVQALKVRVYRLDLEEYFRRKGTVEGIEALQLEIVKPDLSAEWKLEEAKPFTLVEADRPLPLQGAGAYVVVAGDDDLTATVLFLVSDVETVVKKSVGRQVFAWAFDRATGQPIEGARVLAAGSDRVKEVGKTGKDGVLLADWRENVTNVLVVTERGAASSQVSGGQQVQAGFRSKAYVYAARPVYRPGQTVDWRAILLLAEGGAYRASGVRKAEVTVYDARGLVLTQQEVESTPFGTFSGSFPLDATAPLGKWRVHLAVKKVGEWDGEFSVEEFRKPEFTLSIQAETPVHLTGEKVSARIRLRYAFGGPVANAPVSWEVYRLPRTFAVSDVDDYSWYVKGDERAPQERSQGGALVARGESTTDDAGDAVVSFETAEKDEDAEYVVRAAAMDVTRRWIGDEGRIPVTRRDHMALVRTDRKVYKPKQEVRVEVRTVDALERPLARSGTLQLLRVKRAATARILEDRKGGPVEVREEEVEVASYPVTTNAQGTAEVKLSFPQPGRWRLRWRATDARGALVTAFADADASGEAEDATKDARVVTSRSLYREGESAEAMVQSPVTGVSALFTHEGEKVLAYRFVRLDGASTLVDLPVLGEHAPNVFLKVAIPGKARLLEAETEIVVLRQLDVTVKFSKDEAKPGDEVEVTVEAKDVSGKPVKAEVGVAVVDESLYAVAPDRAPPIRPYFYDKRRANAVVTSSSLGFKSFGTTRETSKDVLANSAAQSGEAQQVFARSALRLAREAVQRGDWQSAVAQAMQASEADPTSWDVRAFLADLRTKEEARKVLAEIDSIEVSKKAMKDDLRDEEKAVERASHAEARLRAAPGAARPVPVPKPADARWANDKAGACGAAAGETEQSDNDMTIAGAASGGGGASGVYGKRKAVRRLESKGGESNPLFGAEGAEPVLVVQGDNGVFYNDGKDVAYAARPESLFLHFAADGDRERFAAVQQAQQAMGLAFDAAGAAATEVRKNFADTASWTPALTTGDDGRATVKLTLPDNLTTWRAVVRGVSSSALVGEGRARIVSTRPILVRVDPPRFLVQTDSVTVPVAVHNESGKEVDVRIGLSAEGVTLSGEDASARIENGGRKVVDRDALAKDPGAVRFEASATSAAGSDRAEVRLGAAPRGIRRIDGRTGSSETGKADTQSTFVEVPEGAIPGATRLAVVFTPGLDDALLDALLFLDLYPYGCVEQTVHRFLPALEARAALVAAGSPAAARLAKLDDAIRQAAIRLRNLQADDGSFGWFRAGGGNLEMTAYALLGLVGAREAGVADLDRSIAAAAQVLPNLLAGGTEDARALAHWALARAGAPNPDAYATTFRRRTDDLSVAGLAWLALAAKEMGRDYDAEESVRLLIERRVEKDGFTSWKGRAEDCFVGSDREATALAVRALVETRTASPHAERGIEWLLANRTEGGFGTTKDVAAFVGAAAAYLRTGRMHGFGGTLEVRLDGKAVRALRVGPGGLEPGDRRFLVPEAASLAPGRHEVAFALQGEGRLRWAVRLEAVVASDDLPGETNGLAVERRYLKPEEAPVEGQPPRTKPGHEVLRPSARPKLDPEDLKAVAAGDKVLVRLELVAPRDLQYVLVEDPLPAGCEVLEGTAAGAFDWQERRDDRQVFFCSKVPKGPFVLTYVVQATHWGRFTALGTAAYAMYAPEVHARAAGRVLGVTRRDPAGPHAETTPTPDELFAQAKRLVAERKGREARPILVALLKEPLLDEVVEEIEVMLLAQAIEANDAKEIVRSREELLRRNPQRLPSDLDAARAIAFAYETIGEHEGASTQFLGLVARGLDLRADYDGALAKRGREVEALDLLGRDLKSFPVANQTASLAFQRAQRYRELPRPEGRERKAGRPMDEETLDALWAITAHYADTAAAGPATYALVDAERRAGDLDGAVSVGEAFLRRFPKSPFVDDTRFFLADSRFRKFEPAPTPDGARAVVEAATPLTTDRFPTGDGKSTALSEFRSRAYHLLARVQHVLGNLDEAVKLYRQASDVEDAREALAFLTEERLSMDETAASPVEGKARFPVRYRNVKEVALKAYPVDLQVLFALRKTLVGLNQIDLSGISPTHRWTAPLEGAQDHQAHEALLELPAGEGKAGAWLVVAKAGDHEAGTLVLKTDLKAVLQPVGEKVRVYVTGPDGKPVRGAYVTVSDGSRIRARGVTDGRGLFEAPGVGATPAVVVSAGDRYAIAR